MTNNYYKGNFSSEYAPLDAQTKGNRYFHLRKTIIDSA